ncbi:hypothetical protein CEE39_05560 [bacterium (candidate division B38) B3_B38]|nr:MAG: hypothetical protein CEE39_05560 [bacterium (candidate division B38) B3_B38]
MDRRTFLATAMAAGATAISTTTKGRAASSPGKKFKMKYAPHFGMFKHHAGKDLIDQLKFMADAGFTAMEDNSMMRRPKELQEKIARQMSRLDMTMGVFVGFGMGRFGEKNFVTNDKEMRRQMVGEMKKAVEVAKRVNAKWCTVVPCAYDPGLEWDYQTTNAIENLKYCAEVCEPSGLVMVLEPLNPYRDHPGLFRYARR